MIKFHFIYKTTNLLNGKYYVGMHSTCNLEDGYMGSGKLLCRSINKHGKENFKREILEFFVDRISLAKREREIINVDLLKDPLCMNLHTGGEGGTNEETQRKRSIAGALAKKIKCKEDKLYRDNLSKNITKALLKSYANGRKIQTPDWTNKRHTEEAKKKIGLTNSIKQKGENNSQFGTCWINNEIISKKIKKEEIDTYVQLNWKLGRIKNISRVGLEGPARVS